MAIEAPYQNIDPATGLPYEPSGVANVPPGARTPSNNADKPYVAPPTYREPETALSFDPYAFGTLNAYNGNQNNWYVAQGVATITMPDGRVVPNPFDLTADEMQLALSGNPNAALQLKSSLAARGKADMFHNILNYYEAGGVGFNGGGLNAADAAAAGMGYARANQGKDANGAPLGEWIGNKSEEALAFMVANGQAVKGADGRYYYPADPYYTAGGAGVGTPAAAALGYGGAPAGGGGGGGVNAPSYGAVDPTQMGGGAPVARAATPTEAPAAREARMAAGEEQYIAPGNAGYNGPWTPPTGDYNKALSDLAATRLAPTDSGNPMDFFDDEGYKFRLGEGKKGIENSAASRGGLLSGNTLKGLEKYAGDLATDEYGKAYTRYADKRNFDLGANQWDTNFGFAANKDLRDYATGVSQWGANFDRAGNQWERSFDRAGDQWNKTFDRSGDQWNQAFDWSKYTNNRDFDYAANVGDRDFNEGTRRWDLGFNYGAAAGDRAFNYGTLSDLAKLGLGSIDSGNRLNLTGAGMQGQNSLTGAGATGAAGVSNANIANMTVSELLRWLANKGA